MSKKLIQAEMQNEKPVSIHGQKVVVLSKVDFERRQMVLNLLLLALVASLIIWYAFWSNFLAAGEYKENLLKSKLLEMTAKNNDLVSQKSDAVNLGSLLVFNKQVGLIEQKNVEYIHPTAEVARNVENAETFSQ